VQNFPHQLLKMSAGSRLLVNSLREKLKVSNFKAFFAKAGVRIGSESGVWLRMG